MKTMKKVEYEVLPDQVIAGVSSIHDNGHEDRKFTLTICTLTPRCTELESIVYDYDKMQSSMKTVVAGQAIKDNLNHPEAGIIKATISKNMQKTLSDSYEFIKEQSSTLGERYSLGVSAAYSWGPKAAFASWEFSFTAEFEETWESTNTETWSRNNEKSITEENGFQISFQDTCPANHYCVSQVTMETGQAKIPYKMTAYTKGKPSEKCTEKGVLQIESSFNAKSTVTSSRSKVKTCPLDCQCKPWKDCKWAAETVNLLQSTSNESYKAKLIKNKCHIPIEGVCCCGPEQESPEDYNGRGL